DEEHVVEGEALAAELAIELQQPLDVVGAQLSCFGLRPGDEGTNLHGQGENAKSFTERRYRPRVRALLATAGLLVLAGAAAAAPPAGHTLRKSPSGPIEAIAQDGGNVAWLTSGGVKTCDAGHVLAP